MTSHSRDVTSAAADVTVVSGSAVARRWLNAGVTISAVHGRWWILAILPTTTHVFDGGLHVPVTTPQNRKKEPVFFCVHFFRYLTETGDFFNIY